MPTAPTPPPGVSNNRIATTAFVMNALQGSIIITITNAPENKILSIGATATLDGGGYSASAMANAAGQIVIPVERYGDYTIAYNNPCIKGDMTASINSNMPTYLAANYEETITYTVRIDENNSNPMTACVYLDDAANMVKGSADWDSMPVFGGIKPCVLKDGRVQYYLQPDNFNLKLDNTPSTLTGEDGDVMIEIRKFAYRIYKEDNYIYVSVTNDPAQVAADSRYTYDAFSRLTEGDLDKFYKGAFKGYIDAEGKLRSIAGVLPANNKNIGAFRAAAQLNGEHYQQSTYAQLKALQCLYIIKYGTLNGQAALGKGVVSVSAAIETGGTLENGMNYGATTDGSHHVKLFGIEDFWGNIWEWVDGLTTNGTRDLITSWNSFSNEGVPATSDTFVTGLEANASSWNKKVAGTTAAGFMPIEFGGSSSTYWADFGYLYASCVLLFGGRWNNGDYAGPFNLRAEDGASTAGAGIGARLSYV